MVNLKHITTALLLATSSALAGTPADTYNDNYDFTFPCDGAEHVLTFPVGHMAISKAAWDFNFGAYTGRMSWLVVGRASDSAYLLFDMSNRWHNREDWPPPYFNTTVADHINIAGSCVAAPAVYGKVQVWYVE